MATGCVPAARKRRLHPASRLALRPPLSPKKASALMTAAAAHHDHPLHVLGALALELRGDAPVAHVALAQAEAGELAGHIARDLASFAPEAAQLQLVPVGAHY